MQKFESKLELNQDLLEKNKALKEGEVIGVKVFSNCTGEHEIKLLLRKCADCNELFFQSEKCKFVAVRCDNCSKMKKNQFHSKEFLEQKAEGAKALETLKRLEGEAIDRNKFLVKYK